MIILARTMYSEAPDRNPAELLDDGRFPDENSLEEHLLAGFVPTVYRRRVVERRVVERSATRHRERHRDPKRAERWLGFLAHHLARLDGDQQDLAWWRIGDSVRLSTRLLSVVVSSALCVTLAVWFVNLINVPFPVGEALMSSCSMGRPPVSPTGVSTRSWSGSAPLPSNPPMCGCGCPAGAPASAADRCARSSPGSAPCCRADS